MNTKTDPTCEVCREHPVFKDSLCAECAEIEIETLRREYNELRAEVERLKEELETTTKAYIGCCALVTNAEAEAERLFAQRDETARQWAADLADKDRENERLRAFVQKVALYSNDAWLAREADELAPGASL